MQIIEATRGLRGRVSGRYVFALNLSIKILDFLTLGYRKGTLSSLSTFRCRRLSLDRREDISILPGRQKASLPGNN